MTDGPQQPHDPTQHWNGGGPPPPAQPGAAPNYLDAAAATSPRSTSPMLIVGIVALVAVLGLGAVVLLTRGGGDDVATSTTEAPDTTDAPEGTDEPRTTDDPEATDGPTVDELAAAVVQVQLMRGDQIVCTGSGTIIATDGTILTNSHVISPSPPCQYDRITIATIDIPELPPQPLFDADILVDDPALDIALVRIARRLDGGEVIAEFPTVAIGDSDDLRLGDRLRVIGFPGVGGETVTFTEGTISGFVAQPGIGERSWLKTDTTISGGNSGGLAVNDAGELVGVPTIVGTGEGRIADCRFVEDTNGDGRLDEDDNCVPVGGFINGIRPVNVAVPLIETARTATPVVPGTVPEPTAPPSTDPAPTTPATTAAPEAPSTPPTSDVPLSDTVVASNGRFSLATDDGLPAPEAFVIPDGATQLCLTWDYTGFEPGAEYLLAWAIGGEIDEPSLNTGTNQGSVDGTFFGCITNDAGLAPGRYEAVWLVNGEGVFTHGIYVGGSRAGHTVGIQNNTDSRVCGVQWAPVGSDTPGLFRNLAPVEPGELFTTTLATGSYTTHVRDCDGNVIFEETAGTEFTDDATLELTP